MNNIFSTYGKIKLSDLIKCINDNPKIFTKGLDTEIVSGDFEGNYYHRNFEISSDGRKLFLGFELHDD